VAGLVAVLSLVAAADGPHLPDLGHEAAAIVSPVEERRLGEEIMREVRRSLDFVEDPELERYVRNVGTRLATHIRAVHPDFEFFVIRNSSINAFALPGGFVGVHTGLLLAAESEEELAAVLAHEIAHVTQRHWPRMVADEQRRSTITLASMLAAIVLAGSSPQGAEAAIAAGAAANIDAQLSFTRAYEHEADRVGINLLADSGYRTEAMASFFEKLDSQYRLQTSLPEFVRTHPITQNRIAEARDNAARYTPGPLADPARFALVKARVRALYGDDPDKGIAYFRARITEGDQFAARYGYAQALLQQGRLQAAAEAVQPLLTNHPQYLQFQLLAADIEFTRGERKTALARYQSLLRDHRDNAQVARQYAAALMAAGRAPESVELLVKSTRANPRDAALQLMLARAAGTAGDQLTAHISMADYHLIYADRHAALDQLQLALKYVNGSFYKRAQLEARIRELESSLADASTKK
jgi:predicted Zn-dependent protease